MSGDLTVTSGHHISLGIMRRTGMQEAVVELRKKQST